MSPAVSRAAKFLTDLSLAPCSNGPSMAQATSTGITLKGSVAIVTEFFEYAINNILYQREVYPPTHFKKKSAYGLGLSVVNPDVDEKLARYLSTVLDKVKTWLDEGTVQKLVLVIMTKETAEKPSETLERWVFDLQPSPASEKPVEKDRKEIQAEIAAIQRQIIASTSFMPMTDEARVFDLLVYTNEDVETPGAWEESDAREFQENQSEQVQLRTLDTTKHKVDSFVSYRLVED